SSENKTISETLHVLLKSKFYEFDKKKQLGFFTINTAEFNDNQKAHDQFWAIYKRPPAEEYWGYITDRRDLIVPQDVRERKGSFYTPTKWVELSQKYLADVFGVDWQDEFYVWDCAAGTGNLIVGLTNKYNIWASTLDKQDVAVMKNRIKNGANLLESHVFQFDFLNDDFSQLPKSLQDVINDPKLRKKLIIYINPPYAEAPKRSFYEESKRAVEQSKMNAKYADILGQANREVFAQFFTRIYMEIPDAILAHFSTIKILQGQHFVKYRNFFLAKLIKMFTCPGNSFDNVSGSFPIGFMIWDTKSKEKFNHIVADVYNREGKKISKKNFYAYDDSQYINDWIKPFRAKKEDKSIIGKFPFMSNDFQQQSIIQITSLDMVYNKAAGQFLINVGNLIYTSIYFAVRKVIHATWLNDRDQFLYPNNKWKKDIEFHNDCLAYTLFNNNIQSKYGVNHWIPFSETEVNAKERFESHFMISFISGIVIPNAYSELFEQEDNNYCTKREFSPEATKVFDAGRELWKYYHTQPNININASLYDIREYFQGRNEKGKMNNKSKNETYNNLMENLRTELKILAQKIEPKVYDYGFLLK
ncbi:MAG: hypothetical protein FWH18_06830, partial [Marinilabiliaceae bacterium]|nr:hypothetical protein [Marinilabiliaceae bacterium]